MASQPGRTALTRAVLARPVADPRPLLHHRQSETRFPRSAQLGKARFHPRYSRSPDFTRVPQGSSPRLPRARDLPGESWGSGGVPEGVAGPSTSPSFMASRARRPPGPAPIAISSREGWSRGPAPHSGPASSPGGPRDGVFLQPPRRRSGDLCAQPRPWDFERGIVATSPAPFPARLTGPPGGARPPPLVSLARWRGSDAVRERSGSLRKARASPGVPPSRTVRPAWSAGSASPRAGHRRARAAVSPFRAPPSSAVFATCP